MRKRRKDKGKQRQDKGDTMTVTEVHRGREKVLWRGGKKKQEQVPKQKVGTFIEVGRWEG